MQNLPLATLGTFILWMGWFGFNGGSVLAMASKESADAVAMVFVNTNAAAAGGVIAALLFAKLWFWKSRLNYDVKWRISRSCSNYCWSRYAKRI